MDKRRRIVRRQQVHFAIDLAAPAVAGLFSKVAPESSDQPPLDRQPQQRLTTSSCPLEDRFAVHRSASNDPGTR